MTFSFLCVGTFSRPCPLPGVLSVRCVCCKEQERIMMKKMNLKMFDKMGIALETTVCCNITKVT